MRWSCLLPGHLDDRTWFSHPHSNVTPSLIKRWLLSRFSTGTSIPSFRTTIPTIVPLGHLPQTKMFRSPMQSVASFFCLGRPMRGHKKTRSFRVSNCLFFFGCERRSDHNVERSTTINCIFSEPTENKGRDAASSRSPCLGGRMNFN